MNGASHSGVEKGAYSHRASLYVLYIVRGRRVRIPTEAPHLAVVYVPWSQGQDHIWSVCSIVNTRKSVVVAMNPIFRFLSASRRTNNLHIYFIVVVDSYYWKIS